MRAQIASHRGVAEIRSGAKRGDVFLLGILKGAAVFLSDLLRAIDGDVSYGFIDVVRDFSDTATASAVEIDYISHIDIAGRNVYVVKDVVSTGVIENYLLTQLRMHSPSSLQLVALIDRPSQRTVDLKADYRAFESDDGDGAFVGYGLDADITPNFSKVAPHASLLHDAAEGGLAVALAECALFSGIGAEIELPPDAPRRFGEGGGQAIVSCDEEFAQGLRGVPLRRLGVVGGDSICGVPLNELRKAWS